MQHLKDRLNATKETIEATKKELGISSSEPPSIKPEEKPTNPDSIKKTVKEKPSVKIEPILFVNGKLNKVDHEYISKNFFVKKGLHKEINLYCKGLDTAIFNYLLHMGLESLKKAGEHISVDISDIESRYS